MISSTARAVTGNRLFDRGQRRLGEAHHRRIVEADDRQVARHRKAAARATSSVASAIWSLLAMIAVGGRPHRAVRARVAAGFNAEITLRRASRRSTGPPPPSPRASRRRAIRSVHIRATRK
jgi:hypothetical protein